MVVHKDKVRSFLPTYQTQTHLLASNLWTLIFSQLCLFYIPSKFSFFTSFDFAGLQLKLYFLFSLSYTEVPLVSFKSEPLIGPINQSHTQNLGLLACSLINLKAVSSYIYLYIYTYRAKKNKLPVSWSRFFLLLCLLETKSG